MKEKWEAPSCERCNKELGKIEENLLLRLGLCLDPLDAKSYGIPEKVLRSVSPEFGRNEKDVMIRKKRREKLLNEVVTSKLPPTEGVFPNFGPLPNVQYDEYLSVYLDPSEIKRFAEKIIRGIVYIADNSYIDNTYKFECYVVNEQSIPEFTNIIDNSSTNFDLTPGLLVKRALVENEAIAGLYSIEIWERLKVYCSILPQHI